MTHVGEAVGVGGDVEEEGGALEDVEDVAVLARVQQQIVRAVQVLHRRRQATRVVVVERLHLRRLPHLLLQLATMRLVKNQMSLRKQQARVRNDAVVLFYGGN